MVLGVLSDTHDDAAATRAGLAALAAAGAEYYVHCGDVGDRGVLDLLAGLQVAIVWGNNDYDRQALGDYAAGLGIGVHDPIAKLNLGGKVVFVTHGDRPSVLRPVLQKELCDYLFVGHTHATLDERHGRVRVINPGALHRARVRSVATLNLATDLLTFIPVVV